MTAYSYTITSNTNDVSLGTGGTYGSPLTIGSGVSVGGGTAIYAQNTATIHNQGTIGGSQYGIYLEDGGSITNDSGATITGGNVGINTKEFGASTTVANSGNIYGNNFGVYLGDGGSITNATHASIGAGTQDGIAIKYGTAAVVNDGTITSTNLYGVNIYGGTSGTVENAGTITGGNGVAVYLGESDSNRLIVDPGAKFNGIVEANSAATNTLELASSSAAGTITSFGTQYTGFGAIAIDPGAAWTVAGSKTALEGATITGFNSLDTLDLTDLTFHDGETAVLSGDKLVIDGSVTIQMDSGVTGDTFQVLDDGHGHTLVEETPCYCRGTRIRTPKGEVAVEALKIGDRVTTADGTLLPIKWIGRRNYRDWLAVGNADVQPILFKAGSIADHVPARDLYVSPEHAMFLDGILVPAQHLVNGVSILKVEGMEEIEYFHFEFDRHVVIFAEGAAAESFVDDDSRMLFHNADEYRRLYPNEPRGRYTEFCAPRVEAGVALDTIHRTLAIRATRLSPDGATAPIAAQQGCLDRATHTTVEGWAFAEAGEPVRLAILVNGAVVGQTVANRYLADFATAGIAHRRCGFRFALPHGLSPDIGHRIEVRRESDWSLLTGGCVTLEPDSVGVPSIHQAVAMDFARSESILDVSR
jgi:O-antigen biosynthesis protein